MIVMDAVPPVLEWSGAILGLIGAAMLAINHKVSRFGWLFFLASNVCWVVYGIATHAFGLVTMQAGLTVTTLIGIYRWFRPQ
jgi:hypothetical protein